PRSAVHTHSLHDALPIYMRGEENANQIHQELGEWMTDNVTVVRENDRLKKTDEKLVELLERWENIDVGDTSEWSNQGVMFTRQRSEEHTSELQSRFDLVC